MKAPKRITSLYLPHDEIMTINEGDPDLTPIDIPLLSPPPLGFIDGYGLLPEEQKWHRPVIPEALKRIQKESDSIAQCWEKLDIKRSDYRKEIDWIRKMWYYRLNGYWCYINGKPTRITPAHFLLLGFMSLNVGKPKYRDRGRKYHTVLEWAKNYTFDFKEKIFNDKGERLPNKRGDELEDLGERTIIGVVNPKGRRFFATTDALAWVIEKATISIRKRHGIQGYDEASSSEPYLELVKNFRTMPFFFMPEFQKDAAYSLELKVPNAGVFDDSGLQSVIESARTGHSGYFDGRELETYILDEAGKKVREKLTLGWGTCKRFLAHGDDKVILGFAILPSNSGEYKKGGGREYQEFIRNSNYYERKPNGRTKTGCVTLFLPSDEGADGYTDGFGNSLKDKARKDFLSSRQHLLIEDTQESIEQYQKDCREMPLYLAECFLYGSGTQGYDPIIVGKRINELSFGKKETVIGDFVWTKGFGSAVEFKETPFGKWEVSELLPVEQTNLRYIRNGVFHPKQRGSYMHCSDTFNYSETEHKKQSKGAIIGIKRRQYASHDDEKDISKWTTPDISYTYLARPKTVDEFVEDTLKCNIYYGGVQSPESNNERVRQLYIKWGYEGYLFYFRDEEGLFRKTAGYIKNERTGEELITHSARYTLLHGHRIKHLRLLHQMKDFRGVEDITKLDLIAVFGGACMSIENDYRSDQIPRKTANVGIGDLFHSRLF